MAVPEDSSARREEIRFEQAAVWGTTPARLEPMFILRKMRGAMDVFASSSLTEGSWSGWSIIRERAEGPRALEMTASRSTAEGVMGKL